VAWRAVLSLARAASVDVTCPVCRTNDASRMPGSTTPMGSITGSEAGSGSAPTRRSDRLRGEKVGGVAAAPIGADRRWFVGAGPDRSWCWCQCHPLPCGVSVIERSRRWRDVRPSSRSWARGRWRPVSGSGRFHPAALAGEPSGPGLRTVFCAEGDWRRAEAG
jgi:hypothetical protein